MLIRLIVIFSSLIVLLSLKLYFIFSIVLIVFYIFNFIAIYGVLNNKRTNNQNKFIWIVSLLLLPGSGAYIYYSTSRIPKKKIQKIKKSNLLKSDINKNFSNTTLKLLDSGDEKFKLLFSELRKAKKYINIQYFIIKEGIIFSQLQKILIEKADQGVKIRILYDYIGSGLIERKAFKKLIDHNIEVVEFGKINWLQTNGFDNFRNHNKIVVIDGKKAFFGGINLSDEYAMIDSYFGDWYDAHFFLEGEIVEGLNNVFSHHWYMETNEIINSEYVYNFPKIENKKQNHKNLKLLVDSPYKSKPVFYRELVEQIKNSKKSIKIITPYVVIPSSLRQYIREASVRGVKIELITLGKADKKFPYFVGGFELDSLYDIGVKIYRTKNIFCHTKMFIFDDEKVIFGTTNLDFRALYLHFETNILIESKDLKQFVNLFETYKEKSVEHLTSRREWSFSRGAIYIFIRMIKGIL